MNTSRGTCLAGMICACALGLGSAPCRAVPPNDTCPNAQVITLPGLNTLIHIPGSNVNATTDVTNSSCSINDDLDVWYRLTAPATANYTFDTINSSLGDTTLSIYNTCAGLEIACNDDIDNASGVLWSALTMHLNAGQTIRIRVAGFNDDSGSFMLNVIGAVPPANDACTAAETILVNEIKAGNTAGADTTMFLDNAACGSFIGSGGGKDVFYSFTPTATGPYKVSLCGSGFDTVLAVLTNCTGDISSILACNDDSPTCPNTSRSEIASVTLTADTSYLIRVAGFFFNTGPEYGPYSLIVQPVAGAAGVCCRGSTCAVIAQAACAPSGTAGARFIPTAAVCNSGGSATTPCCYADYNKTGGVTVGDIFDFLNDWFAGSPMASVGGNGFPTLLAVQNIFDFLTAWFAGGC